MQLRRCREKAGRASARHRQSVRQHDRVRAELHSAATGRSAGVDRETVGCGHRGAGFLGQAAAGVEDTRHGVSRAPGERSRDSALRQSSTPVPRNSCSCRFSVIGPGNARTMCSRRGLRARSGCGQCGRVKSRTSGTVEMAQTQGSMKPHYGFRQFWREEVGWMAEKLQVHSNNTADGIANNIGLREEGRGRLFKRYRDISSPSTTSWRQRETWWNSITAHHSHIECHRSSVGAAGSARVLNTHCCASLVTLTLKKKQLSTLIPMRITFP